MPRGDRTGPQGFGPMTGRAAGYCAGYGVPGYMNPAFGQGFGGRGRGFYGGGRRGRGSYRAFGAPMYGWNMVPCPPGPVDSHYGYYGVPEITPEQEITMLREQSMYIKKEMDTINERIKELEGIAAGGKSTE